MPPKKECVLPLEGFFSYKPPVVRPGTAATTSPSSRGPQDFDMHLAKDMILKRVVVVPEMAEEFMAIAEGAAQARKKLPRPPTRIQRILGPITLPKIFEDEQDARQINKEPDLQAYYQSTVGSFCSIIAATLAFDTASWDTDSLQWRILTSSRSNEDNFEFPTGFGTRAHADGFLLATSHGAHYTGTLPLISRFFSTIAITEFKNLTFGNRPDMENILMTSLAPVFKWKGCNLEEKCTVTHERSLTGTKMGPDAQQSQVPSVQRLKSNPGVVEPFKPSTTASSRSAKSKAGRKAQKTKKGVEQPQEPPPDQHGARQTSYHVVQQIWTAMCDNDATYGVITAGNGELVCERDRSTQTLYMSGFIDIPNTFYLKLHTGIFIAAIRDATNRAMLLSISIPKQWTRSFDVLVDFSTSSAESLPDDVRQEFQKRPWLILRVDDGPGAPTGPFFQNELYLRSGVDSSVVEPANDESLVIVTTIFDSEYDDTQERHSRGRVSFKNCLLPPESESALTVFVETAKGDEAVGQLRRAHTIYQDLHTKGDFLIPKVYGYYEYRHITRGIFGALVLEFAGRSVRRCLADPDYPLASVEVTRRDAFERELKKLILAGYAFDEICEDNLLISGEDAKCIAISGLHRMKDIKQEPSFPDLHLSSLVASIRKLFPNRLVRSREDESEDKDLNEERATKRSRLTLKDGKPIGIPGSLRRTLSLPWKNLDIVQYL